MDSRNMLNFDRGTAVAGQFYPASEAELLHELDVLDAGSEKQQTYSIPHNEYLQAIIVPHAGYIFSGAVASSAFHLLQSCGKRISRVFLLGVSHHTVFPGASIFTGRSYKSPLGKIPVDQELVHQLIDKYPELCYREEAHRYEHSLEVQLPFLNKHLGKHFMIVPILIGSQDKELARRLAKILSNFLEPGNLFVISTDLSHYPAYRDAVETDRLTTEALCTNDPAAFLQQLDMNARASISNLSTSMCSWMAVLTLLHMTTGKPGYAYHPILYQNSGDIPVYGEKSRVVGYQSLALTRKITTDDSGWHGLTSKDKEFLLNTARRAIISLIDHRKTNDDTPEYTSAGIQRNLGAFVSIYINDELRGCIGKLQSETPLKESIHELAISAASSDSRFQPVHNNELSSLKIEISVLSPMRRIFDIAEIIPGKHGIYMKKDYRNGTFLPQVAERMNWNALQMLEECSLRKAGLGKNGWKQAKIYTYEAEIFSEPGA